MSSVKMAKNIFAGTYMEGNMTKPIDIIVFNKKNLITGDKDFPFPVNTGKGKIYNLWGNTQLELEWFQGV